MNVKGWLVVTAHGAMRMVKNRPALRYDEVAFPVTVNMPQRPWGRVQQQPIDITLPEGPEPEVRVGEPETPEELEPLPDEDDAS